MDDLAQLLQNREFKKFHRVLKYSNPNQETNGCEPIFLYCYRKKYFDEFKACYEHPNFNLDEKLLSHIDIKSKYYTDLLLFLIKNDKLKSIHKEYFLSCLFCNPEIIKVALSRFDLTDDLREFGHLTLWILENEQATLADIKKQEYYFQDPLKPENSFKARVVDIILFQSLLLSRESLVDECFNNGGNILATFDEISFYSSIVRSKFYNKYNFFEIFKNEKDEEKTLSFLQSCYRFEDHIFKYILELNEYKRDNNYYENKRYLLNTFCGRASLEKVKMVYDKVSNPDLIDETNFSVLENACIFENIPVIKFLLTKDVIVSNRSSDASHALYFSRDSYLATRILLQSPKINISETWKSWTAFEAASNMGCYKVVREYIRSGRLTKEEIENAKKKLLKNQDLILKWLRLSEQDQNELYGWSNLFCITVLISDGYVRSKGQVSRIFKILLALPLELQMILCNRVYGRSFDFISSEEIEIVCCDILKFLGE